MLMIDCAVEAPRKNPFIGWWFRTRERRQSADYLEQVGFYDPNQDPPEISIDLEKMDQWQSQGAGVSDTVSR